MLLRFSDPKRKEEAFRPGGCVEDTRLKFGAPELAKQETRVMRPSNLPMGYQVLKILFRRQFLEVSSLILRYSMMERRRLSRTCGHWTSNC